MPPKSARSAPIRASVDATTGEVQVAGWPIVLSGNLTTWEIKPLLTKKLLSPVEGSVSPVGIYQSLPVLLGESEVTLGLCFEGEQLRELTLGLEDPEFWKPSSYAPYAALLKQLFPQRVVKSKFRSIAKFRHGIAEARFNSNQSALTTPGSSLRITYESPRNMRDPMRLKISGV